MKVMNFVKCMDLNKKESLAVDSVRLFLYICQKEVI